MYDCLIIGAGVVGAATARELSKYNLKIAVLEKGTEVCQGTSKSNSAIVHGGYDASYGTLKGKLNVRGTRLFEDLSKELNIPFDKCGSLVLAFNDEDEKKLEELYENGQKNGVKGLKIIEKDEILMMEPNVSREVTKALYCSEAGIICPFNATFAFIENAMDNGVELFLDEKVIGIDKGDDAIIVRTEKGIEFQTKILINSAGLYSDEIANLAGDYEFSVNPRRGEYRILDKKVSDIVKHVIFTTPTKDGKGVLVSPTVHGNIIVGPTSDPIEDKEDTRTTDLGINKVDEVALRLVPNLALNETIRVFAGVRASISQGDFLIYESKNIKGMLHLGGIDSPGLASSPAIAEEVRDFVAKYIDLVEKTDFVKERRAIPHFYDLSDAEKEEILKTNPNYKKIICRCEMITEGEIVEAIHRNAGARTVDGIKRRVRPGSGRCQGGFCGPRVLEILSRELGIPVEEILKESQGSNIVVGRTKGVL